MLCCKLVVHLACSCLWSLIHVYSMLLPIIFVIWYHSKFTTCIMLSGRIMTIIAHHTMHCLRCEKIHLWSIIYNIKNAQKDIVLLCVDLKLKSAYNVSCNVYHFIVSFGVDATFKLRSTPWLLGMVPISSLLKKIMW